MASSTEQVTSQAPSRPVSPTDPSDDHRNDEVAGDESAPLLQSATSPTTRSVPSRPYQFLISTGLLSSMLTLLFLIVTLVLMSALPYGWHMPYGSQDAMTGVAIPVRIRAALHPCSMLLTHSRRYLQYLLAPSIKPAFEKSGRLFP